MNCLGNLCLSQVHGDVILSSKTFSFSFYVESYDCSWINFVCAVSFGWDLFSPRVYSIVQVPFVNAFVKNQSIILLNDRLLTSAKICVAQFGSGLLPLTFTCVEWAHNCIWMIIFCFLPPPPFPIFKLKILRKEKRNANLLSELVWVWP